MAIYHLQVKTIKRSAGRSAVAAAAYRAGERIVDERTRETHNYRSKSDVMHTQIVLPPSVPKWAADRAKLWNQAEARENRKNSVTAREIEIALPVELDQEEQKRLTGDFAQELVDRYRIACDIAIHRAGRGDPRNTHAHILMTTRRIGHEGLEEKTRELDQRQSGEIDWIRERWATIQNRELHAAGLEVRVDHRSLADQGIDREPGRHLGPASAAMERKNRDASRRQREIAAETPADDRAIEEQAHRARVALRPLEDRRGVLEQTLEDAQEANRLAAQHVLDHQSQLEAFRGRHRGRAWLEESFGFGSRQLRTITSNYQHALAHRQQTDQDVDRAESELAQFSRVTKALQDYLDDCVEIEALDRELRSLQAERKRLLDRQHNRAERSKPSPDLGRDHDLGPSR